MRNAAILMLALVPLAAGAQIYKWKDPQGRVHYTQTPPPGVTAESIGPVAPPQAAPNQDAINQTLQKEVKERPKVREETAKSEAAQADRQRRCKEARDQLAYMEQAGAHRMATTDAQGNVSRVTEDEYLQRRSQLQQVVAETCG